MSPIPYEYYNAPIPGGGYVTGFVFDPEDEDCLYCRSDIGGCYRFLREEDRWKSLIEHVGMEDLSETFPIAIEAKNKTLYIACGDGRKAPWLPDPDEVLAPCGRLCISYDRGEHFVYEDIPCYIHGNMNGRGTGKRLVASASGRLYFASQRDGLGIRETDGSWHFSPVCGEAFLSFVYVSADEQMILAGSAGISNRKGEQRGHSLYLSTDGGASFSPLAEPADPSTERYSGSVAHRYAADERYLYVTFSCTEPDAYSGWMGYSCDGGHCRHGRLMRYTLSGLCAQSTPEDITPEGKETALPYGLGGVAVCKALPGLLACASICRETADILWISYDYGDHWQRALHDMDTGNLHFHAPYLRAECSGGHSPVHWMTDLAIRPSDPDEIWFNTGTGIFSSRNFTRADRSFSDRCMGIEETVHLNLYSPPSGEVQLIDILGDLGGFAFRDLHSPCANSFADAKENRYITCINADFPDHDPSLIAVTARGNWKGMTRGGVILSRDNAASWERLPLPFGLNDELDRICHNIECPNVNPGWVAMSADGKTLLFTAAEGIKLWQRHTVRYDGKWEAVHTPAGVSSKMKVFADRVDKDYFYGFGENSRLYVSRNGGRSFSEKASPLPGGIEFGLIDCANKTEIRGDAGFFGRFYIALEKHGLWLLEYQKDTDSFRARQLTQPGDTVFRCGLGILKPPYTGGPKMIYISGILDGHYGFYRSADEGRSWQLLNDEKHRFGEINSIEGDSRCPGRFFIATGSLGVVVGEEKRKDGIES